MSLYLFSLFFLFFLNNASKAYKCCPKGKEIEYGVELQCFSGSSDSTGQLEIQSDEDCDFFSKKFPVSLQDVHCWANNSNDFKKIGFISLSCLKSTEEASILARRFANPRMFSRVDPFPIDSYKYEDDYIFNISLVALGSIFIAGLFITGVSLCVIFCCKENTPKK